MKHKHNLVGISYVGDGFLAGKALRKEHLLEVVLAVRLAIVLFEISGVEHTIAPWVRAYETVGMPLLAHGKHRLVIGNEKVRID